MGKIILLFLFCSISVFAKPYELLSNGDFEKIENGKLLGWSNLTKRGHMEITEDAQKGKYAVHLQSDNLPGDNLILYTGVNHGGIGGYLVIPGGKYRISVMARGKGEFTFYLNFSRMSGGHIRSTFLRDSTYNLTYEWTQYSKDIVIPDNLEIGKLSVGIALYGNTDATVDNVSLSFDPADNPNVENIYDSQSFIRNFPLEITTCNAIVHVYLNGKKVHSSNNQYNLEISEGINVVGMLVTRKNDDASFTISSLDYPAINSRWKTTCRYNAEWLSRDFDDSNWKIVKPESTDKITQLNLTENVSYFRQLVLWNKTHYGQNRFIVPPVKIYGFPTGGIETFRLALYSPLTQNLDDFEFDLELPLEFKLLDLDTLKEGVKDNIKPSSISHNLSDNGKYNVYKLKYDSKFLSPDKTFYTLVPIKMNSPAKKENIVFKYSRSANGNFTELMQTIPINILPPVNGRILKKIKIQQYKSISPTEMSSEHVQEYVKQCVNAGCNSIIISSSNDSLYQKYLKNNSKTDFLMWLQGSFPMRLKLWGEVPAYVKEMIAWMNNNPDAKPRYYNDRPKHLWISGNSGVYYGVLCPSYITGAGKASYQKILKKLFTEEFYKYPQANGLFIDWEESPWRKTQTGLWCFCDRCKAAFMRKYKISASQMLTDEIIRDKYNKQWDEFRAELDGEVIKVIHEVCADMGKTLQVYQWEGDLKFWKACSKVVDVFTTVPGNSPANGNRQRYIDSSFEKLRDAMGINFLIGQRFPFLNVGRKKDSWKNIQVCSADGFFLQQKEWKSEILRTIAGVHGGIDIQNAMQLSSGALYYIGEATRIISKYEDLFLEGKRNDKLVQSAQLAYPDLLVLQKDDERLILAFNESDNPIEVVVVNKQLKNGQKAELFEKEGQFDPTNISLTIAPHDVEIIHIK
jgi:hypothetical protein